MASPRNKLAIVCSGGPAPGINAVIGSAAIQAINHDITVIGIYDGFKWISTDRFVPERHTKVLTIAEVGRIHFDGGSILRIARTALLDESRLRQSMVVAPDPVKVGHTIRHFTQMGVTHLLTIGGDDTALSARLISDAAKGRIRVIHVPKTIDNDLPLPGDVPTFGFNTARDLGSQLIANLMEDARTTGRWYVVVVMGRHAGFLALGIGKSTGATLTLIPEEFQCTLTMQYLSDVIDGSIIKRQAMDRPYGVAVVAEGLAYRLGDREELKRLLGKEVPIDASGHLRLAEVPLARLLTDELRKRLSERGDSTTVIPQTIGYMLRCARPTPFDMAYGRDLGNGAIRLLLDDTLDRKDGVMVTIEDGNIRPVCFSEMIDPETNRTRIRVVDVNSDAFLVAQAYMIRLEPQDFQDSVMLARLASAARMSEEEFVSRYRPIADGVPPSVEKRS